MAGPGVFSYSTTPANNVQANTGINWDEGMSPAAVNNSARQNMTDYRNAFNDLIWFKYGKGDLDYSPVYVSATSFKIAGADVSLIYHVGRRVRATGSGTGTIYGTISVVAFSTDTTVTVVWDSGSLSNETLVVSISQIPVTGLPIPASGLATTPVIPNLISGLTLSAAGSTGTFGIAAGQAADSTNAALLILGSAYTKTTSAWAVGSGNGGLDTSSIANATWYHVWLIKRVDTGVVDVLFSTSASSPTMPTNYTLKRRIGSMRTDGSAQWIAFTQNGDEFLWSSPILDANNVTPGATTASSLTLNVPSGVKVNALTSLFLNYVSATTYALITSLDTTDVSPAPSTGMVTTVNSSGNVGVVALSTRTNTSSQVRARFSSTGCAYYLYTLGWNDKRGKDG